MIHVGIIGVGGIAGVHMQGYQHIPDQRIVALCDIIPERASGNAEQVALNIGTSAGTAVQAKAYTDYRDLLADDEVEVVDLCLPTDLHAEVAIAALNAGKHVLCEKPMALNVAQCDAMIAAAQANERFLMVAHVIRFWPEYQKLVEIVKSGQYGAVCSAAFQRLSAMPRWVEWYGQPERSGGALLDLHIHDADFIAHLFGMPSRVLSSGYEDHTGISRILTTYQYDHNALITAEGTWAYHDGFPFGMSFAVRLQEATVAWGPNLPLTLYRDGYDPSPIEVPQAMAYGTEIAYFLDCVRHQTPPTVVTPWHARESVRLVLAEGESVHTGRAVSL